MKPFKTRQPTARRRGSILAMMPAIIVVLCMIAGFAVDMGYLYSVHSDLQSGADAAAFAGALQLRTQPGSKASDVRKPAIRYAQLNAPQFGSVLVTADITLGVWDFNTKTFTPTNTEPNAVRTTVRRDGANTASVSTFFMPVFGVNDVGVTATAIAAFIDGGSGGTSSRAHIVQ
jgi:Flp pilus assembly protein TadG